MQNVEQPAVEQPSLTAEIVCESSPPFDTADIEAVLRAFQFATTLPFRQVWLGEKEAGFSFTRYDYAHGVKEPVISSTSHRAMPDFHRQQERGLMTCENSYMTQY